MLHGCEIWEAQSLNMLEILYRKFKNVNLTPKAIYTKLVKWTNYRFKSLLTSHLLQNVNMEMAMPVYRQIYVYNTELCTLCNLKVIADEYHYILMIHTSD